MIFISSINVTLQCTSFRHLCYCGQRGRRSGRGKHWWTKMRLIWRRRCHMAWSCISRCEEHIRARRTWNRFVYISLLFVYLNDGLTSCWGYWGHRESRWGWTIYNGLSSVGHDRWRWLNLRLFSVGGFSSNRNLEADSRTSSGFLQVGFGATWIHLLWLPSYWSPVHPYLTSNGPAHSWCRGCCVGIIIFRCRCGGIFGDCCPWWSIMSFGYQ